jgi:hypothetical protein
MLLAPLPHYGNTDWQVFTAQQDTTTSRGWQTWLKPPGASWIFLLALGGGGGGGGGQSTAAAARTGGGGGGAGSMTRVLVPAMMFPDVLYIRAGVGGSAGAAAGNGGVGSVSYVALGRRPGFKYT